MADQDWTKLQQLFHQALKLPEQEVDDFLTTKCADDPKLKQQILELLATEKTEKINLTEQVAGSVQDFMFNKNMQGYEIGAYRIVKEIGRGGMGCVYLAERADQSFQQKVAIKLLPSITYSATAELRFINERQILAQLQHPNIAHLIDGGALPTGEPYFAMEYVEGENILYYCDRHNLTIQQRLELFKHVCEAVAYAHRQLVLHRDIKPSNILVTNQEQVKLLDFGIAKLLHQGTADKELTQQQQYMMTPEYASPEQVLGETMGVSSDVYQLGLLLYQLLTGQVAQQVSSGSVLEIKQAVIDSTPTNPSAKASNTYSEKWRRQLKGDLDTIVLKCLHKAPELRYLSVEALLDDIRSYQTLKPIKARAVSRGYKLKRFIQRNWLTVTASSITVLALIGGLSFSLLSLQKTRIAEKKAAAEADTANQITQFLIDMLTTADPRESGGEQLTVQEVVETSAERVSQLDQQPITQAQVLTVMGQVYYMIEQTDKATEFLQRAVSLARQHVEQKPDNLIDALSHLSEAYKEQDQMEAALTASEESIALAREHNMLTIRSLHNQATLLFRMDRFDEANQLATEALNLPYSGHKDIRMRILVLDKLGLFADQQGKYELALDYFDQALKLVSDQPEFRFPKREVMLHKAAVQGELGNWPAAEQTLKETLEQSTQLFGQHHKEVLLVLSELARIQIRIPNLAAAELTLKQANQTADKIDATRSSTYLNLLVQKAELYRYQGRYTRTIDTYIQAETLATELLGSEDVTTVVTRAFKSGPFAALGRFNALAENAEQAIQDYSQSIPIEHPLIVGQREYRAKAHVGMGKLIRAEQLAIELLSTVENKGAAYRRYAFGALEALFDVYSLRGDIDKTENTLTKIDDLLDLNQDRMKAYTEPKYQQMLARHHASIGEYQQALAYQQKAVELLLQRVAADNPTAQQYQMRKALYLAYNREYENALSLAAQSQQQWLDLVDVSEPKSIELVLRHVRTLLQAKRFDEAKQLLSKNMDAMEKTLGTEHHLRHIAQCLVHRADIKSQKPMKAIQALSEKFGENSPVLKICGTLEM